MTDGPTRVSRAAASRRHEHHSQPGHHRRQPDTHVPGEEQEGRLHRREGRLLRVTGSVRPARHQRRGQDLLLEIVEGLAPPTNGTSPSWRRPAGDRARFVLNWASCAVRRSAQGAHRRGDDAHVGRTGPAPAGRPGPRRRRPQSPHRRARRLALRWRAATPRPACALPTPPASSSSTSRHRPDPESRSRTWDLLTALKARGVTMILTTHYLEEAERLADRIAIMHRGQIAVEGRLDELVATEGAEISVTLPGDNGTVPPDALPSFPGTQVTRDGAKLRIETNALQDDTRRLLDWASTQGVAFETFSARPASPERVFSRIAGKGPQSDRPEQTGTDRRRTMSTRQLLPTIRPPVPRSSVSWRWPAPRPCSSSGTRPC